MLEEGIILTRLREALRGAECPGPVSIAEIEAAEATLGVRFPLSYRLFLRNFGAALLSSSYDIEGLPPCRNTDPEPPLWSHIVDTTEMLRHAGGGHFPHAYLQVCHDGMECGFCLDTGNMNENGECPVVVWGPGFNDEVAAPSFLAFLENASSGNPLVELG